MKALSVVGVKELELQDLPIPEPAAGEVLIKVAYCGICGSDIPRYFDGGVHSFPQILGHEFSGEIAGAGEGVDLAAAGLAEGAPVVVAPLVPCGHCDMCETGNPQLCPHYSFIGSRRPGAMAQYVTAPVQNCLPVPEGLDLKVAATIEPLTVGLHGIERVRTKAGDRTLVLGAGTIGLMTVLALRARGVGEITVVDINDEKLKKATEIGADVVLNPASVDLKAHFEEHGYPELVFETAGNHITQVQAVEFAGRKARVVFVGTAHKDVNFPAKTFELILRRELEITGTWMSFGAPFPGYVWKAALRYLSTGAIDPRPLITGVYSLDDVALPFEKMHERGSKEVKVLYKCN